MGEYDPFGWLSAVTGWIGEHSGITALVIVALLTLVVHLAIALRLSTRRQAASGTLRGRFDDPSQLRVEKELEFLFDFIGEFSNLLTELETQVELRRIPSILVRAMMRIFHAEQALMVVRRKATMASPEGNSLLIVAATATAERGLALGTEMAVGEGHLGIVAESQQVLSRKDFEREHDATAGGWPVFYLAAPMVANDVTIGAIAVDRPHRRHERDKDILRMIAQLGAMTWTNIAAFRNVRVAADMDELTGIYNKRALRFKMSELVFSARQDGHELSVYLFDIDNFKHYNDTNGHVAGDHLLRSLAQLVRETVRTDDIFGRFGGEEFLLILPGRSKEQAVQAAENVRQRIAEYAFPFGEKQPQGMLTVSGGVATFPMDADDVVELLKAADGALYRAKDGGRNRTCEAETGLNPIWT